jgi:hypothetical protein
MCGGKTVTQLLAEASAVVPFMALQELKARLDAGANDLVVLDVRENGPYDSATFPAPNICRVGSWNYASTKNCLIRQPSREGQRVADRGSV